MSLCEVCRRVFQYRGSDKYGYNNRVGGHHASTSSLTEAASAGCRICSHIQERALKELERETLEKVEMRLKIDGVTVDLDGEGTIRAHIENCLIVHGLAERPEREIWQYLGVIAVARPTLPISVHVGYQYSGDHRPLSEVLAANTAKTFMSRCLKDHAQCGAGIASTKYPTRLLELSDTTARIIYPLNDGALGPYVALSYCWGPKPNFLRLTYENKDELQSWFSLRRLPRAFREAIELVKNLGYRYIWIDSLCIFQKGAGSAQDWRSESARMGDVYANCILVLSLSRASNPEASCLGGPGSHALLPPFPVQLGDEAFTMFDTAHYTHAKYRQPLGSRAWTFQEQVLAPRVLALGQGELFWDCLELRAASESFPLGMTSRLLREIGLRRFEIAFPSKRLPLHDFYISWLRALDNYTGRNLTFVEKDKLIALGAVASRICRVQNDVYVAGHFLSTLPYSLLWRLHNVWDGENISGKMGKRVDSPDMKTPSWSWASITGPVRHYYGSQPLSENGWPEMLVTMLETPSVNLVDPNNPYGQCSPASITISTVCTEIVWNEATYTWRLLDKTKTLGNYDKWDNVDLIVWLDDPEQRHKMEDGAQFTLAAFCDGYLMGEDQPLTGRQGLVLRECVEDTGKVYKRVAHFRLGVREKPKAGQTLEEFENAQTKRGWKNVQEVFGSENRTLVLV